jgi:HEAT repeat protein
MKRLSILLLGAAAMLAASAAAGRPLPALPQSQSEQADALYGRARRALDDKNYEEASKLFDSFLTRFPRSVYTPDALYWKGFALYRSGSLEAAQAALEVQAQRFPNAATRADAEPLLILIKGERAKRGDSTSRREVDVAASRGDGCGDMEVRIAALDALQQMDAERVLPLLRRVLARRDECSKQLRKNALFILAQKGGIERDKLLLEIAKSDPNPSVRKDAVFYLGQAKGDAAIDALEEILLRGDDAGVRSDALFALAQMNNDRARKILEQTAMTDGAPMQLRKDAMFHIASRQSTATNKWLVAMITNAKAPPEMRKDAVFYLAQQKADASDDIAAVYDGSLPSQLKKDMLFYIGQRKDDASLLKLIAIAKSDPNMELRKDALFYLAQSKDPRALKALEELALP